MSRTMDCESVAEFCYKHGACQEGREWALTQPDMAEVFDNCKRSDWLIWALQKQGALDKPTSVKLACEFALRVLPNYEAAHKRTEPRTAIESALRWLENPTEENRRAASAAADAADVAAIDAAYAARASAYTAGCDAYAAYAAYAARASAYTAGCDAYAACSVAYNAAYNAACSTAYNAEQKAQCGIIRKHVKNPWRKQ